MAWIIKNLKYILLIAAIVAIGIIYFKSRGSEVEEKPIPEVPKLEVVSDSTEINKLKESHLEEVEVWRQKVEDLTALSQVKDRTIARMKKNRKANNDNVRDEDLNRSIQESLSTLEKLGY